MRKPFLKWNIAFSTVLRYLDSALEIHIVFLQCKKYKRITLIDGWRVWGYSKWQGATNRVKKHVLWRLTQTNTKNKQLNEEVGCRGLVGLFVNKFTTAPRDPSSKPGEGKNIWWSLSSSFSTSTSTYMPGQINRESQDSMTLWVDKKNPATSIVAPKFFQP